MVVRVAARSGAGGYKVESILQSCDVLVVHRGRTYRLCDLLDRLLLRRSIVEEISETCGSQLQSVISDVAQLERQVQQLEASQPWVGQLLEVMIVQRGSK